MPTYSVSYRDKNQKPCFTGRGGDRPHIVAQGVFEVYSEIQSIGGSIIDIQQLSDSRLKGWLRKIANTKMSFKFGANPSEFAMLCDVLRALLSSGVPVLRAVKLTAEESANPWLAKKLAMVVDLIEKGQPLSSAMDSIKKTFPIILVSAIQAGEKIGAVPKSLEKMAILFRRKAEIRRETISAMIYPMVAILVFFVVCIVITIKVPEALQDAIGSDIKKVLSQLPLTIRILFMLKENPIYLASPFILIGVFMALVALGKKFKPTRLMIARLARKVPALGKMRAEFALVDFLESISLNQESGIKIGESLELIRKTTSDPLIQDAVERVRERILALGLSLSTSLAPEKVFPGLVRQMVTAAESGGNLAEMLKPIADYYDLLARATLKRMIDMMTPGIIILLGSVIGPVIMGVYKTLLLMQKLVAGGGGV